ncbi:MAG: M48 family metalloprotease [candidate division Zixibacteria bacterium]|nr:M48 family metalloprotease [candidate division Zixibacteria bacterium]
MNKGNNSLGCCGRLHADVDDCGSGRVTHALTYIWLALITLMVGVGIAGCAVNSATGERHLNLVGESQEIAMGRQADSQVVASLGLYPNAALQRYVQELGTKLAKTSERPDLPWIFRVVDDPVVNAFALPGGFIYVTRGLMTYVKNEAELSGVIGHEIGHVTAQHAVHSMSNQQITQLGVTAGMMIEPKLQRYGQYLNAGLGLLYLKFSRDDESQADHLGFRYMVRAGNDPRQMIGVFDMLSRVSQAGGGGRLPEWLETHPNPVNRSEDFQKEIDTLKLNLSRLSVNQDSYLSRINGVVFGQNPREGFFRNNHFYQPDLQFEFEFPSGWQTVNQKEAVAAINSSQDAVVQITLAQGTSSAKAAKQFFGQQGMQSERLETGNLNGLPAVSAKFRAQTEQGVLQGKAAFVEYKGHTYQLLGYTTEQLWAKYQDIIVGSMGSFRRLTDPKILQMQPMHLKIITVKRPSTLGELAKQEGSPVQLETLAIINQTEANAGFKVGDRVKMVIGEKIGTE